MSTLTKRHFWEWFRRNHQEYLTLKNKSKKEAAYWLNELNAHLRAYYKFFGFSLEWRREQTAVLTITVHGKAMHFKKADALVAKAPDIPGWTIAALEIPRPIDFFLEQQMEDTGIDPRELRFSFVNDDPDYADIIVYHPLCTRENKYLIYELAKAAVYNLLGERCFGSNIRWMDVTNLSFAIPGDTKELEALPDCIGRSAMVVDGKGKLVGVE
jgi:hypothetical protein